MKKDLQGMFNRFSLKKKKEEPEELDDAAKAAAIL